MHFRNSLHRRAAFSICDSEKPQFSLQYSRNPETEDSKAVHSLMEEYGFLGETVAFFRVPLSHTSLSFAIAAAHTKSPLIPKQSLLPSSNKAFPRSGEYSISTDSRYLFRVS